MQYKPRNPDESLLHKVAGENLISFEQSVGCKAEGNSLPLFVRKELEKFLNCGVIKKGLALFNIISAAGQRLWRFHAKAGAFAPVVAENV